MMTNEIRDQILKFKEENPFAGSESIAKHFGTTRRRVRTILGRRAKSLPQLDYDQVATSPVESAKNPAGKCGERTYSESDDKAEVSVIVPRIIRTLDDAIDAAQVDTTIWEVKDWEATQWSVTIADDGSGQPCERQNYRVHMKLRRIVPRDVEESIARVLKYWEDRVPARPTEDWVQITSSDNYLAVFCLFDAHFGKLCWEGETGVNYDLDIASRVYENAVDDMVKRVNGLTISRVLFPIGNDQFQSDNVAGTTTSGTRVDCDGRYHKVFDRVTVAVESAINRLSEIAPVDVVLVPGNHDRTVSYHLAQFMWALYRRSNRVRVDRSPIVRKYYRYGCNLIGLTHGDDVKLPELPQLMAAEAATAWSQTSCREWLHGHFHSLKKLQVKGIDSRPGVILRGLESIGGTDSWHFGKGFVGQPRRAEVLLYDRDSGFAGQWVVNARDIQPVKSHIPVVDCEWQPDSEMSHLVPDEMIAS